MQFAGGAAIGLLIGNIMSVRWNVDAKKLHWFIVSLMLYVLNAVCFVYTCRRLIDLSNECRYGGILLAVSGSSEEVERYTTGFIATCALLSVALAGCLQCYARREDKINNINKNNINAPLLAGESASRARISDSQARLIDKYSELQYKWPTFV